MHSVLVHPSKYASILKVFIAVLRSAFSDAIQKRHGREKPGPVTLESVRARGLAKVITQTTRIQRSR